MAISIPLGTAAEVTQLYSHQNSPTCVWTLAETVKHWFDMTLDRDGLAEIGARCSVTAQSGRYLLTLDGPAELTPMLKQYAVRLPKFLAHGWEAFNSVIPKIKKQGRWDPSPDSPAAGEPPYRPWRFFMPHGMAMLNQKSLQFFHYPPIRLLEGTQDYLQDPVPVRCIELLAANGVPQADLPFFNTVMDATPVAAADDQGSKPGGDKTFGLIPIQDFHVYQKAQTKLLLNRSSTRPGYTVPIVVYGSHPAQTFEALYGVKLSETVTSKGQSKYVAIATTAEVIRGLKTPVLSSLHPYVFYGMAQGFDSIGSGLFPAANASQALATMQSDLAVTRWQKQMSDDPSLDPQTVYLDCVKYWKKASQQSTVCALARHQGSLFYATPASLNFTFKVSMDDALAFCQANGNSPCDLPPPAQKK